MALSVEQAQEAFAAVAALGDQIPFRWIREGCECRAQLMIEHLQTLGIEAGRVWALGVGRSLVVANPSNPRHPFTWNNHVAPTVAVEGVENGVLVIDPSLSRTGPLTIKAWVGAMRVKAFEVSTIGLSKAEILNRQTERGLAGAPFDAIVFILKVGEPPIPESGGSGFILDPDPPEGISTFVANRVRRLLVLQNQLPPGES